MPIRFRPAPRRGLARLLLMAAVLALGVPVFAIPVMAHAILIDSQPAPNTVAAAGRVQFQMRYNSRIDRERSRLSLQTPEGQSTDLAIAAEGAPNVLHSEADLRPGTYDLHWQVLAVDGHITRGILTFSVTGP